MQTTFAGISFIFRHDCHAHGSNRCCWEALFHAQQTRKATELIPAACPRPLRALEAGDASRSMRIDRRPLQTRTLSGRLACLCEPAPLGEYRLPPRWWVSATACDRRPPVTQHAICPCGCSCRLPGRGDFVAGHPRAGLLGPRWLWRLRWPHSLDSLGRLSWVHRICRYSCSRHETKPRRMGCAQQGVVRL